MAIALVANTIAQSTGTGSVTTSGINTTGASLIVVGFAGYVDSPFGTLTDSNGNTWTPLTTYQASGDTKWKVKLYYAENPTVGSGHTFTWTSTFNYPSISVAAFSGAKTSTVFDVENGGTVASGTTLATGSVTPSEDNELLVSILGHNDTVTISIDGSFTISDQVSKSVGHAIGLAMAYKIQTSLGAENPTWTNSATFSASDPGMAAIATFKAVAAGGGGSIIGDGNLLEGARLFNGRIAA